jgi:mxaL protein
VTHTAGRQTIAALRRLARHPSRAPALAALLLLLAFAMPSVRLPRDTVEALVIFDITQSMDVEDVELDGALVSRIAFARESARRSLRDLPCGSRVGWGVFTEYRTLVLLAPIEVCGNYGDLLATLDRIDGRVRWGNASEISKGVFWALRASKELGTTPSVLFVTDGQESPPLGSSSYPMFDDLKAGQVRGWLLGVGGKVPKPIPRTNAQGERVGFWRADDVIQRDTPPGAPRSHEHLSALNEAHLRGLAAEVGFDYAALDEPQGFARALRDPRLARRAKVATDLSWLPAAAALLLLALHFRPDSLRSIRAAAQAVSRTSGT